MAGDWFQSRSDYKQRRNSLEAGGAMAVRERERHIVPAICLPAHLGYCVDAISPMIKIYLIY